MELSNSNVTGIIIPVSNLYYSSIGTSIFNFDINNYDVSGFYPLITNITTINITNNNIVNIGTIFAANTYKPINNFIFKNKSKIFKKGYKNHKTKRN